MPRPGAGRRVRPEPAVPTRSTKANSACPAASRTGFWSSITKSGTDPSRERAVGRRQRSGARWRRLPRRRSCPPSSPPRPPCCRSRNSPISRRSTDLADPFRDADFTRWRSLSAREDMRFIGVALPRLLARPPWEDDPRADRRLSLCGVCARAPRPRVDERRLRLRRRGRARLRATIPGRPTCAAPRPIASAAASSTDLPIEPFRTDPDQIWVRCAARDRLTDRQEASLVEAGLMPLSALPLRRGSGVRRGRAACRRRQRYHRPDRRRGQRQCAAVRRRSTRCCARRASPITSRCIGRDMVGSFKTAEEIEAQLQGWLTHLRQLATCPAGRRCGRAIRWSAAGSRCANGRADPACFGCVILLQPHFQLDDVDGVLPPRHRHHRAGR